MDVELVDDGYQQNVHLRREDNHVVGLDLHPIGLQEVRNGGQQDGQSQLPFSKVSGSLATMIMFSRLSSLNIL